jgi:hypothetical protein
MIYSNRKFDYFVTVIVPNGVYNIETHMVFGILLGVNCRVVTQQKIS